MFRAPSQAGLPPLTFLLEDLPARRPAVARHLGISSRTLERYAGAQQAPRAIMLALFWESRWGMSVVDSELHNRAQVDRQQAAGLRRENAALRRRIEGLERELSRADTGAANLPYFSSFLP